MVLTAKLEALNNHCNKHYTAGHLKDEISHLSILHFACSDNTIRHVSDKSLIHMPRPLPLASRRRLTGSCFSLHAHSWRRLDPQC